MQVFVTIDKDRIKINTCVNVKSWLIKVDVIKDLFVILVIVIVSVINHVMQDSIKKFGSVEKNYNEPVDNLVEECIENIDENEMIYNWTLNDKKVCSSCTIYIALFAIFWIISTIISTVFIYFH